MADETSRDVDLHFGVLRRPILGPKNYCMYTKLVGEIIKRHNIKYRCHVDDTRVYMTLKPSDKWDGISSSIETYIEDITICMNSNMLTLNKDKTELIIFSCNWEYSH